MESNHLYTLSEMDEGYKQNIHYGLKNTNLLKILFTIHHFCAKLSIFQKDIHFGYFFHIRKRRKAVSLRPAVPFLAAHIFG